MEDDDIFLSPELEDTFYLLTVENRLKELKQECEGLTEQSKHLHLDGQLLREDFKNRMKLSRALQRDLVKHIEYFRAIQEELWSTTIELQKYLKDD